MHPRKSRCYFFFKNSENENWYNTQCPGCKLFNTAAHFHCVFGKINYPVYEVESCKCNWEENPWILVYFTGASKGGRGWRGCDRRWRQCDGSSSEDLAGLEGWNYWQGQGGDSFLQLILGVRMLLYDLDTSEFIDSPKLQFTIFKVRDNYYFLGKIFFFPKQSQLPRVPSLLTLSLGVRRQWVPFSWPSVCEYW